MAADFQEQDNTREKAFSIFLDQIKQRPRKEDKDWLENLESGDPSAFETAKLVFDNWYDNHKIMFFSNYEKLRAEAKELETKMEEQKAYTIVERHLSTTPQEIFELLENQAHISAIKKKAEHKPSRPDNK